MQTAQRLMIALVAASIVFNMPFAAAQSAEPVRLAQGTRLFLEHRLGKTGLDYTVLARRGYYE